MIISQEIEVEVSFFLRSAVLGMFLLVGYDVLRALRRVIIHPDGIVAFTDVIYWCLAGVLMFLLSMDANDGMVRFYAVLSTLFGMLLYHKLLSRIWLKLLVMFGNSVKGGVKAIFFRKSH